MLLFTCAFQHATRVLYMFAVRCMVYCVYAPLQVYVVRSIKSTLHGAAAFIMYTGGPRLKPK